jgi:hypothetical protein
MSWKGISFETKFSKDLSEKVTNNAVMAKYLERAVMDGFRKVSKRNQGLLYLIAVRKETIDNPKTNYAYRAHPRGFVCDCSCGVAGKMNHKHFLEVLNKQQRGESAQCRSLPSYRLLTHNLEHDKSKKIIAFHGMQEGEMKTYWGQMRPVKQLLQGVVRLESINEKTTQEQLLSILLRMDTTNKDEKYIKGIKQILLAKRTFIAEHKEYLLDNMPEEEAKRLQELVTL